MNITFEFCSCLTTGTSFLDTYSLVNDEDDDDKKAISKTTMATYARLQRQSPMTSTIASNRYRTNHRVLGNIVNALINLQKYTVSRFPMRFFLCFPLKTIFYQQHAESILENSIDPTATVFQREIQIN